MESLLPSLFGSNSATLVALVTLLPLKREGSGPFETSYGQVIKQGKFEFFKIFNDFIRNLSVLFLFFSLIFINIFCFLALFSLTFFVNLA